MIGLWLIIFIGCSVQTQKGRESFDSGSLHPQLEKLANQKMELRPLKNEIIQRMQQDANLTTLPVAVIDNGVDIAQPDLISKYIYEIQNGEITGVGHDFMGDDNFASSVLINPEVFAFNASEIKEGLIVANTKNPFQEMLDLDKEFAEFFTQELKTVDFSNTVLKKISSVSINVFGAYRFFLGQQDNKHTYFDPENYELNKTIGSLLTLDFRNKVKGNIVLRNTWGLGAIHSILDKPQSYLDASSGISDLFYYLNIIEGGDRFAEFVVNTFNKFPKKDRVIAGTESLAVFRDQRDQNVQIDHEQSVFDACGFLSKTLEYFKQGSSTLDPITSLFSFTESHLLANIELFRNEEDYPALNLTSTAVDETLKQSYDKMDIYMNILPTIKMSAQEKFAARQFKKAYGISKEFIAEFKAERGSEFGKILQEPYKSKFSSLYRKHYFRSMHPFLAAESESESHGTHVSGIISAQNDNLRIFPMRITTRSALVTRTEYARLLKEFKESFKDWLKEPIVIRAIYKKIPSLVIDPNKEPKTTDEKEAYASKMMADFDEAIDIIFEGESLNFIFFEELLKAIEMVGQKKIKLANISLGAETENQIPKFSEIDTSVDLPKVFRFLHFEFVKYKAAQVLKTTSRNSLFIIAAGNSSTWIDGKSKSALPVDLSSRFLGEFEDPDLIAPNNHITNILGVGSLSPDEDLSGFTNIILGIKTPMIFAIGENILSPIKMTDLSPVSSYIEKKIPSWSIPIGFSDERILSQLKTRPEFSIVKDRSSFEMNLSLYFDYAPFTLNTVESVYKTQLAFQYSDHRENFSGTSMATPAVVGVTGDWILQQAQKLNLKTSEIYDHPQMTPENLIQEIFKIAKPVFADNPNYPFKKLDVRGKYQRGTQIQNLDQKINKVLSRVQPAISSIN